VVGVAAGITGGQAPLRAAVGAMGEMIGSGLGKAAALAGCGAAAIATDGVGLLLCPAATAAATIGGGALGSAAATRIFDALGPPPEPEPEPPADQPPAVDAAAEAPGSG